jgi:hypothetical protein
MDLRLDPTAELPGARLLLDCEAKEVSFGDGLLPGIRDVNLAIRDAALTDGSLSIPSLRLDGSITPGEPVINLREVSLRGARIKPTAALAQRLRALLGQPSTGESEVRGMELTSLMLEDCQIDTSLCSDLPRITGTVGAHLQGIHWQPGQPLRLGEQRLDLSALEMRPPDGDGYVKLPKASLTLAASRDDRMIQVADATLAGMEVSWTTAMEALLPDMPPRTEPTPTAFPGIQVDKLSMTKCKLSTIRTAMFSWQASAGLDLNLQNLHISPQGVNSPEVQQLALTEVCVAEHPQDREQPLAPILNLSRLDLEMVPEDWKKSLTIKALRLQKPEVVITPENTTFLNATSPTPKGTPFWQQIQVTDLDVAGGGVTFESNLQQRINVSARLAVSTAIANGRPLHTVTVQDGKVHAPELAPAPITTFGSVAATFDWLTLWKTHRLESVRTERASVDVNDTLKRLFMSSKPASPQGVDESDWAINHLAISGSEVTLHNLAPGLPPIKFALDYETKDMPLQPRRLIGRLEPQKVELTGLSLRSPFDPLREVAVLDAVFIHFTLDGLIAGRIDKVEVLSPTLKVGEDLFWYVDYYRQYAAGLTPPDAPPPSIVSSDSNFARQVALETQQLSVKPTAWTLDTLAVSGGKIVIAPKGIPLPGIPRPFPFSFITRLVEGKFEAELQIPSDNYTWEQLQLEFQNLRGNVLFNLPMKQVSNNLTETFRVDVIRYKQLHIEDCFLTITYDASGIYGQFGGEAYGGYVKGAFNIYNDTTYTWDGWITGTGVSTTEITQKMTPTYLLLDGKVDASIIALGNMSEVYQTDLSFTSTAPGKFSITTLNSALESLPADLAGYLQDIARIGIETVRDFDYEKAEGKARFYGREGRGNLRLSGPLGTRNIDINVYDHRWNDAKEKPAQQPVQ